MDLVTSDWRVRLALRYPRRASAPSKSTLSGRLKYAVDCRLSSFQPPAPLCAGAWYVSCEVLCSRTQVFFSGAVASEKYVSRILKSLVNAACGRSGSHAGILRERWPLAYGPSRPPRPNRCQRFVVRMIGWQCLARRTVSIVYGRQRA